MKQFMDIFSLPEMTLLCCVNDFFMKHNIDYEPVHLYKDVKVSRRFQPPWKDALTSLPLSAGPRRDACFS